MMVKSLELDYFRNYVHLEAAFDPRVNLIYGDNAQGKTNLLEAIAYLSSARSHRARYDREMIQMGIDSAFLKGEVFSRNRDFTLEAKLFRGRGRQLFSNGVRLKTAGELSGILTTVLFCPEDLNLIRNEWGNIIRQMGMSIRPSFRDTVVEPSGDSCLCIVFSDPINYAIGNRPSVIGSLERFVAEKYGKTIYFKTRQRETGERSNTIYVSDEELREKIHMDISIEEE